MLLLGCILLDRLNIYLDSLVNKRNIALSMLGTKLDAMGKREKTLEKWRPNIALTNHPDLQVDELLLLYSIQFSRLAHRVKQEIEVSNPKTLVNLQPFELDDPWDFEEVYAKLFDWCQGYRFDIDAHNYFFHITTGTHVVQICGYLLTESRHFPGRIIQTSPPKPDDAQAIGGIQIIDLDLSKYDQIASRFDHEHLHGEQFLKSGIATKNVQFNRLISQIETVAIRSPEPILLTGPTGAGKTQLAKRIYQLKKQRGSVTGDLIAVNCATLKGENAMAALFGHTKGAFTGAQKSRDGFLLCANQGVLFLDEFGELGLEEQAMLLHAIEHKSFYPVGSDKAVFSDFQLIAGTNRQLKRAIQQGLFREDLLARINLWTYQLPALKQRREDIEPNLEYELQIYSEKNGRRVRFSREAKTLFLQFAHSEAALWSGNFRDLRSAVTRLCTLADMSRITEQDVLNEIVRLKTSWEFDVAQSDELTVLARYMTEQQRSQLDCFDANQLNFVLQICEKNSSMAAAGRELFDVSRELKVKVNDSSRLQKYLAKFDIRWADIVQRGCNQDNC